MSREYVPYYAKVDSILSKALQEIVEMFKEHNTNRIKLAEPLRFGFRERFCGDESGVVNISYIVVNDSGLISLHTNSEDIYYPYNFSDRTDMTLLYDGVYYHFYSTNN